MNGYTSKEIERLRNEARAILGELRIKDENIARQEKREKSKEFRYHKM